MSSINKSGIPTALTSAHILVGNASNVATDVAVTGDVTVSNAGVTAIGSGKVVAGMIGAGAIVNADISAAAAIAGSKIVAAASGVIGVVNLSNQDFTGEKTFLNGAPALGVQGIVTVPTGFIGEVYSADASGTTSQSSPTLGTYYDLTGATITLPAGDWDLYASATIYSAGVASGAIMNNLSIREGSSTLIVEKAVAKANAATDATGGTYGCGTLLARVQIALSTTKTYKMSMRCVNISGSPAVTSLNADLTAAYSAPNIMARRRR